MMNKSDMYKLFAIGLIVIFGIEMIALGVFNSSNRAASGNNGLQQANGTSLSGTVSDNVTIVRYEPYLIVNGNGTQADAVAQKLISSGVATYFVPSQGSLIVNLKESKDVPAAAVEFEKENLTVYATAVILTSSKLTVVGNGVTTAVDGTSFSLQIRPIYDEGAQAAATFSANVAGGQIVGIGSFAILPILVTGAPVEASVLSVTQGNYIISVPWENRSAAKTFAEAAGAIYKPKSYIIVEQNASQGQLDAMKAAYSYITGTQAGGMGGGGAAVQPGIVSVQNNFADIDKATVDFTLMKLQPVFPASNAYFANQTGNESAVALVSSLKAAGIDANLSSQLTVKVKLPDSIEKDGISYDTGGMELSLALPGVPENATTLNLTLDFEAAGSAITRIIAARQA